MLLHLITAEQFRSQWRLAGSAFICHSCSAEARTQLMQCAFDDLIAHLNFEVSFFLKVRWTNLFPLREIFWKQNPAWLKAILPRLIQE